MFLMEAHVNISPTLRQEKAFEYLVTYDNQHNVTAL